MLATANKPTDIHTQALTDQQIDELYEQEMLQEWLDELAKLWTAFGKVPTSESMTIYQTILGAIPLGLLKIAVLRAIRDHKYNSAPTPHDVWLALARELGNPADIMAAIEDWRRAGWQRLTVWPAVACSVAAETDMPA